MTITDPAIIKRYLGCYGVTRSPGFVGAVIRLFTRSRVNHAFVMVVNESDGSLSCIEAVAAGSKMTGGTKYVTSQGAPQAGVFFNFDMMDVLEGTNPAVRGRIAGSAFRHLAIPYGFLDIVYLGLASLGIKWRWLLRRVQNEHRAICSQLVDLIYNDAGVHLYSDERPFNTVTPGDLEELIAQGRNTNVTDLEG